MCPACGYRVDTTLIIGFSEAVVLPVIAKGAFFGSVPRSGVLLKAGRSEISAVAITQPAGCGGKN